MGNMECCMNDEHIHNSIHSNLNNIFGGKETGNELTVCCYHYSLVKRYIIQYIYLFYIQRNES